MGSDEIDVGEGGINKGEGGSESEDGSKSEDGSESEDESRGVRMKRTFRVMVDEEQIVRDVRDGQRRVKMRMGEVELGGVSRRERRMRLFGELVVRVLKGGCVLCFWLMKREG